MNSKRLLRTLRVRMAVAFALLCAALPSVSAAAPIEGVGTIAGYVSEGVDRPGDYWAFFDYPDFTPLPSCEVVAPVGSEQHAVCRINVEGEVLTRDPALGFFQSFCELGTSRVGGGQGGAGTLRVASHPNGASDDYELEDVTWRVVVRDFVQRTVQLDGRWTRGGESGVFSGTVVLVGTGSGLTEVGIGSWCQYEWLSQARFSLGAG